MTASTTVPPSTPYKRTEPAAEHCTPIVPCRINTYGNSFTQGAQVSDEETWQEYLAAHLGEPIGNYGVGGFGVYQAYRRLRRAEATDEGGRVRHPLYLGRRPSQKLFSLPPRQLPHSKALRTPAMFEGNFWAHLEMDMKKGHLVEKEALLQTPESLYNMTDPDFMYEALKDDLMLQMSLFCRDLHPRDRHQAPYCSGRDAWLFSQRSEPA